MTGGAGDERRTQPGFLKGPAAEAASGMPRVPGYQVIRELGSGGMGSVYEAEDVVLRRRVALKVIRPDAESGAPMGERFLREARALAGIEHENLVRIYQAGKDGGVYWLAMELLKGESLEARIRRNGPAGGNEVVRFARGALRGLAAIHGAGLVHRDLKPGNVWLQAPDDRVRILDLGLVRPIETVTALTQSGMVVGTPAYMAPEQARGDRVDARTDLFSLGSVLYTMCTGRQPFGGTSLMAQLTALAVEEPRPIRETNPGISPGLTRFIARLLAKSPDDRPASAAAALLELESPRPAAPALDFVRKHRKVLLPSAAAAGALLVLLVMLGAFRSKKPAEDASPKVVAAEVPAPEKPVPEPELPPKEEPARPPDPQPEPPREEPKPPVKIPPAEPAFLIDLPEGELCNVWFPRSSGKPGSPDPRAPQDAFRTFGHAGKESPNGIGMHPGPGGPAFATFDLAGRYATFTATVALNDGPREDAATPLTFTVLGDGKILWECKPFQSRTESQECAVSVKDVRELRLEVKCAGEPRAAHALWIEPEVR
ncbi:MAG: protein kinase [Planctomycetes bacterium]|nr:protein kinase [Planctomycetota bacterium]